MVRPARGLRSLRARAGPRTAATTKTRFDFLLVIWLGNIVLGTSLGFVLVRTLKLADGRRIWVPRHLKARLGEVRITILPGLKRLLAIEAR